MKYIKTYFVISIIVVFSNANFAQAPGYLGKKFLVGYGLNTSPALYGANHNNKSIAGADGNSETGNLAFNFIHEGYVEYATTEKWSFGLLTRYYKTIFDNPTTMVENGKEGLSYTYATRPDGYYNITGLSYCLYFKKYKPGYVAPWGKYRMFGPVFNTAIASYDPNVMTLTAQTDWSNNAYGSITQHDTLITNFGSRKQAYKGFNIMYGFGRSRILYNKVVLDYGCNMYLLSFFSNIALIYKKDITTTTYIEKTIGRRVRGINHFNVFLKVGVLLF